MRRVPKIVASFIAIFILSNFAIAQSLSITSLTPNTTSGAAPLFVFFDVEATGTNIVAYQWDFDGDGVYDYATKPDFPDTFFTYRLTGSYTVRCRVININGTTAMATTTITVDPAADPPTFDSGPLASDNTPDIAQTVTFTATATKGAGGAATVPELFFEWEFEGDGFTDITIADTTMEAIGINHTYFEPGAYTVVCKIIDFDGGGNPRLISKGTVSVTVNAPDAANKKVAIIQPVNLFRFGGSRVTFNVFAAPEDLINFSTLKLQYRVSGSGDPWTDGTMSNLNVRDSIATFVWDDSLPGNLYDLRITVDDTSGNTINSDDVGQQGAITIGLGVLGAWGSWEEYTAGGIKNTLKIDNDEGVDSTVSGEDVSVSVEMPIDAILDDNDSAQLIMETLSANPTAEVLGNMAGFSDVSLFDDDDGNGTADGLAELARPIEVAVSYRDDDANGVIDGTNILVAGLKLVHFNSDLGEWEVLPDQDLDLESKTITATAISLSPFALSGEALAVSDSSSSSSGSSAGDSGCGLLGLDTLVLLGIAYIVSRRVK